MSEETSQDSEMMKETTVDFRKMRIWFICIFLVLGIVVDVLAYIYLTVNDHENMPCGREIYTVEECVNDYNEQGFLDGYHTETHEQVTDANYSTIITLILFALNVMVAAIGILIYQIVKNIRLKRVIRTGLFVLALLAVLYLSVLLLQYIHSQISKPIQRTDKVYKVHAPIIYLYDPQSRVATVKLKLEGSLGSTYPLYPEETGWVVRTSPEGILTDGDGREYEYLFWEGDLEMTPDFTKAFCVKGKDTAAFLEEALADLGLTDVEADTFIMYWLPKMEVHPYNVISFQTETYEEAANLNVDPAPDTIVRVNMAYYESDEYVETEEQDLSVLNPSVDERKGFTLVEWGGEEVT